MFSLGMFPTDLQYRLLSAVERMAGLTAADLIAKTGPTLTGSPKTWFTRLVRSLEVIAARTASTGAIGVDGTLTVANAAVTANTRVFTQRAGASGTPGVEYTVAVTPGTGFVISSRQADGSVQTADRSTVFYMLVEMASTVATPAADVGTGTYNNDQTITLTCATPGATIVYTTDGTTPSSTNGKIYGIPFVINTTATVLKAVAIKSGMLDSAQMSAQTYTLTCATPTASPVAGSYSGTQTVTFASATSGVAMRYTTSGTDPTSTTGTVYSGPVTVATSTTYEVIAFRTGYNSSAILSAGYAIS